MQISRKGLDLIKSFEGYLRKLPDGSCIAYRCPAGVLTLGWGCTEGVKEGMRWTRAEAEEALRREIAKHEAAVARLVTVDINQNQRDALISFSYNVGSGALGKSTLLKKLNRGDYAGAQAEFMKWNKAGGKQFRGLSIRRAKEAALFAERMDEPENAMMAQSVDEPIAPMPESAKAAIYTGGTTVAAAGVSSFVAPPPPVVSETVSNVGLWQSMGSTVVEFATFAFSNPPMLGVIVVVVAGIWLAPKAASYFKRPA
jgi:lysozyme